MTHLLSEGKKNSHRGWTTSLHRRQNSGIVDVQDVPPPEHIKNGKKFQISGIWYYFTCTSCLFIFILLCIFGWPQSAAFLGYSRYHLMSVLFSTAATFFLRPVLSRLTLHR